MDAPGPPPTPWSCIYLSLGPSRVWARKGGSVGDRLVSLGSGWAGSLPVVVFKNRQRCGILFLIIMPVEDSCWSHAHDLVSLFLY